MIFISALIAVIIYHALTLSMGIALGAGVAIFLMLFLPPALLHKKLPAELVFPGYTKNKRAIVILAAAAFVLVTGKGLWVGAFQPEASSATSREPSADIMKRRAYLIARVTDPNYTFTDVPPVIDDVFRKQWAMVALSMTSMALTNIALDFPETRESALAAVEKMVPKILETQFRDHENYWWDEDSLDTLDGPNGHAGYLGHLNIVLAAYRVLGGDEKYDDLNRRVTDALARRVAESPNHYIETFPAARFSPSIFVPDTMAVLASIAWSDIAQGTDHSSALRLWSTYNREQNIDSDTGLLHPWVKTGGLGYGQPRGSYAAWNSIFLPHVDFEFGAQQYQALKRNFATTFPPGAGAIREYVRGRRGVGDVDSGPVLFGLSTSGTGFAVAGARMMHDEEFLDRLLRTAEVVGSSWDSQQGRRYLAGPLIGDAIVLAGRTARLWDNRFVRDRGAK